MSVYSSLAPVSINGAVYPVISMNLPFAVITAPIEHSGQLYPTAQIINGATPSLTLQMPFKAAFDLIGFGALTVTAFILGLTRFGDAASKSAGTDHRQLTMGASDRGLATITSVSVTQDGLLVADVDIAFKAASGQTHPLTAGTGAQLTLSAQPVIHTMGPVALTGTKRTGARGWSVDMGQRVESRRSDGDLYPTQVAYLGGSPSITVDHEDADTVLGGISAAGAGALATTVLYGRQMSTANDATFGTIIGGDTGVSITLAAGWIAPETLEAAQNGVAGLSLRLVPANATPDTHPLAVATNATVP